MMLEESTITSSTGLTLFANVWKPKGEVKAVVALVHGFGEHCLRYTPYVELFEPYNIAFVSYDQYGHGQSKGKRGTIMAYDNLLDDVALLIEKAETLFPKRPKFLYGHSMGGNIAFNYLLRRKNTLAGGIITSPWFMLSNEPNFILKAIVNALKQIAPNVTINSGLETKHISTIKQEVVKYDDDPLNHGKISFKLLDAITKNGIAAIEKAQNVNIPVFMAHGSNDKITSPAASALAAQKAPDYIRYKTYENMYHELHNDEVRNDLAKHIGEWIIGKIK